MAVRQDFILAFNRGVLSPLSGYRADVKRTGMSAETQMNWMPRTMGPMSLRPGFRYIGTTATANGVVKHIPFIFSNTDMALIEVTDQQMRFRINEDDAGLITRPAVTSTITNETFDTDLTGWTDDDQGASSSVWAAGGHMALTGTGTLGARRYQEVTVAGADIGVEHALRIVVSHGTVGLRVGSALDLDDYISETYLGEGAHSLALTPTGNFFILFFNRTLDTTTVDSCQMESATVMSFATSLLPSETLDEVRYAQSGDIIFIARGVTRKPMKIERRGTRSWSLVDYLSDNGPWLPDNNTPVTMVPSSFNGQITITASQNYFKGTNVGSLMRITSTGQTAQAALGALNDASGSIRVTGILAARTFSITISGTWAGTIQLQQSLVEEGNWVDVAGQSWTGNVTTTYLDELDNQVAYYRLVMTVYTSGSADVQLHIPTGESTGIARIVEYTNPTVVSAIVLEPFGSLVASTNWAEGAWSDRRGYPSAVAFFQGRLYWAGKDKVWGTVVDDFYNFDPFYVGDAGPINRSIGQGPVDTINWLVPLRIMALGAQGAEYTCRSSSFEEPITPTNFNLREESTIGSYAVEPAKIDSAVVFVDRTGARIMQSDVTLDGMTTNELTILTPEVCLPNIRRVAIQRRPDTRVHLLRCDGTAVVMVFDKTEQVNAFVTVETEGLIEDVAVLPGTPEDHVYYTVARVVDGVVVRYLEKWALTSECEGGTLNKQADSFKLYTANGSATLTGLDHLEGKSVIVWADGKDLGTYTVTGGSITVSESVEDAVVGLPYYAEFVSNKLEFLTIGPAALARKKRVSRVAIAMRNTHKQGLQYGTDWDHLDDLPPVEEETTVPADYIWEQYDNDNLVINGTFDFDTRLHLKATAPRPCTVMAAVITVDSE